MDRNACITEERLILYHYGELDRDESGHIAQHVLLCPACQDRLEELADTLAMVPSEVPDSHEVHRAVRGVLAAVTPGRRSLARRLVPAYVAAAVVAIALPTAVYSPQLNKAPEQAAVPAPVVLAQADWDVLENMDVIFDLDVIQDIDDNNLDELAIND